MNNNPITFIDPWGLFWENSVLYRGQASRHVDIRTQDAFNQGSLSTSVFAAQLRLSQLAGLDLNRITPGVFCNSTKNAVIRFQIAHDYRFEHFGRDDWGVIEAVTWKALSLPFGIVNVLDITDRNRERAIESLLVELTRQRGGWRYVDHMLRRTYFEKLECNRIGLMQGLTQFLYGGLHGAEAALMLRGVRRADLESLIMSEIKKRNFDPFDLSREQLLILHDHIVAVENQILREKYRTIALSPLQLTIDPNRFISPLHAEAYQMGWVHQIADAMQTLANTHGASTLARRDADYQMMYLIRLAYLNLASGYRQRQYEQLMERWR